MGVTGSGKSTVAEILADRLGWPFAEGDTFHPQGNLERMSAGQPLADEDRAPWLDAIAAWVDERLVAGENGLITCSALKRRYRDTINRRGHGVMFAFLNGSKDVLAGRLAARHGHFMPPALLESQLEDLEPPNSDEPAILVDIGPPPHVIAQKIIEQLHSPS